MIDAQSLGHIGDAHAKQDLELTRCAVKRCRNTFRSGKGAKYCLIHRMPAKSHNSSRPVSK